MVVGNEFSTVSGDILDFLQSIPGRYNVYTTCMYLPLCAQTSIC